ncbi:hypothetical protein HWV62_43822 [Athelia sp. TMB]|nr:hypothetical protein HWV62_40078 [Athelia sp. TMB]KAF7985914.1 hypothetical protein HWV62_43822 [Athelia sp. TMB]
MSVVQKSARPLRIIALPLTRPTRLSTQTSSSSSAGGASTPLTYYQFQLKAPVAKAEVPESRLKGYATWASNKAAETWAGWGKAPPGNWKFKVFNYGERLVDRIDFEELALHGVDPSLGPSLVHPDISGSRSKDLDTKDEKTNSVDRTRYLEALIEHGAIVPEESQELEQLKAQYEAPHASTAQATPIPIKTSAEGEDSAPAPKNLLLSRSAIPPLLSTFGLKETVSTEMYRALEQARLRNAPTLPSQAAKSS